MPKNTGCDPLAAKLLSAIRAALTTLDATDLHALPADRMRAGEIRAAVADARSGVLAIDLNELLGHEPTLAERRGAHRALERLERAGFIRRLALGFEGQRTTHVELMCET